MLPPPRLGLRCTFCTNQNIDIIECLVDNLFIGGNTTMPYSQQIDDGDYERVFPAFTGAEVCDGGLVETMK